MCVVVDRHTRQSIQPLGNGHFCGSVLGFQLAANVLYFCSSRLFCAWLGGVASVNYPTANKGLGHGVTL